MAKAVRQAARDAGKSPALQIGISSNPAETSKFGLLLLPHGVRPWPMRRAALAASSGETEMMVALTTPSCNEFRSK